MEALQKKKAVGRPGSSRLGGEGRAPAASGAAANSAPRAATAQSEDAPVVLEKQPQANPPLYVRKRKASEPQEQGTGAAAAAKENVQPQAAAAAAADAAAKPGGAEAAAAAAIAAAVLDKPGGGTTAAAKPSAAVPAAKVLGGGSSSRGPLAAAGGGAARALLPAKRATQTFLDLGQRDFAASRCPACGMVYARGREDDEALHRAHCVAGSRGAKFPGWQRERVLLSDAFKGRLLMVLPSDPASHVKKVEEVAALVERLHCLTPGWLLAGDQWKAFLYVSTQRRVVGLLVAEPLRQALRATLTQRGGGSAAAAQQEADSAPAAEQQQQGPPAAAAAAAGPSVGQEKPRGIWRGLHGRQASHAAQGLSGGTGAAASSLGSGGTARGADSCPSALLRTAQGLGLASPSTVGAAADAGAAGAHGPAPPAATAAAAGGRGGRTLCIDRARPARAAVGVRMVWVSPDQRRAGVASRLLDAARSNMVQCYVAPRAQLAFSQPTEAGAALAAAYVGGPEWLVYGV